ncbi:NHL repeat-containing protein [Dinghuibacter silviterrae]|uniref:NHL repeat-containing protein n=1 Tax=Dinghuibacter silviterrae TaxID=1539049 RepID=A0A4R8DIP4_9BACT|nr:NHL repeat-containing protein [Dinghuibacter silviterrae]TDW97445.1 NHL repeat-containing protein [Dinghuibacter silviterrae]
MTPKSLFLALACALLFSCNKQTGTGLKAVASDAQNPASSYTVSTFAGSGIAGFADGTGTAASFNHPMGLAIDSSGNLYVADVQNLRIRKITPNGVVTTFAGNGQRGSANGVDTVAEFYDPVRLAIDATGNVYVTDAKYNNMIRKITPAGVVTTFAGGGAGTVNGTGTAAKFDDPLGITVNVNGNIYVSDAIYPEIRQLTPQAVVTTFAGSGATGSADGTGAAASFFAPDGMCRDGYGNIYLADANNQKIRKITPAAVVTTIAGTGALGSSDGPGAAASFDGPWDVAIDGLGYLYVCDAINNTIRRISPSDTVATIAGIAGEQGSANGPGSVATFSRPAGVVVDRSGNIYVSDAYNNVIRKLTPNN